MTLFKLLWWKEYFH